MKNPFIRPVSAIERIKSAQVCPHCHAQLFSIWGQDLRKKGPCPECRKRVFSYNSIMLSGREFVLYLIASIVAVAAVGILMWYIHFLETFGR